jgi:hypothetical protein
MSRKLGIRQKNRKPLQPGTYIWLSCEVKPGPFSDERMVRVTSPSGAEVWVGFASVSVLKDPAVVSGSTSIKALIVEVKNNRVEAQPMGSSLTGTLFSEEVSRTELVA